MGYSSLKIASGDKKLQINELDSINIAVEFSKEALERMVRESLSEQERETGGVLIGSWQRGFDRSILIKIKRASGPGMDAVQKAALFRPDLNYYRNRVDYYREKHGWDYMGEWHKHPGSYEKMSLIDEKTADDLLVSEGWPFLLLPIITFDETVLRVDCYVQLSRQMGAKKLIHCATYDLNIQEGVAEEMKLYVSGDQVAEFEASGKMEAQYAGIYNQGESFVFIPTPGPTNAKLRLIRAGNDIVFKDTPNEVTGILGEASPDGEKNIKCYHVHEGEILPLSPILVYPNEDVYERNKGLLETKVLREKSVVIAGCGSIGATVALALARAGVGTFRLFDFDILEPANIARHAADLTSLGRNKAGAVKDMILRVNPAAEVHVCDENIVDESGSQGVFQDAALDSDLIVSTTDTDDSRVLVNSLSVEHNIKSIQIGLHERAASGIIQVVDPENEHACFSCHRRRVLSESALRADSVAYSDAEDPRDLFVQPGLSAQINFVAEAGALRAIESLMNQEALPDLTILYIDQESGNRQLKLRIHHLELEKVPDCPVCGGGKQEEGACAEESDEDDLEPIPAERGENIWGVS